ncbi:undecaprenyldiphospho-muramoylpentapeptide beta-N-acetylglucosaminyltransferase [Cucumibacter marinus]|uniref:undecaprenyldiphospho-muramoylpentapeptide beta-N-acetylglucosaminyltransferase n=1 Tax=Cucumibacter marinus TaxID=1121252 RepID=UPI0004194872|nr:undecaprenyldiphospho-muramoylpentapeptide beta-N-acetylglucosaminyltransferase [Cucumibacter marinus]
MKTFTLMAGGTGGHLFPAQALGQELKRRGHAISLMTDRRTSRYLDVFPANRTYVIPSATPRLRNPIKAIEAGFTILRGMATARSTLKKLQPDAVIGFGGYPTFPPFLMASLMGIPGLLHEQNAVMGAANRALARFADGLALSFDDTRHADKFAIARTVTGNPVRDAVLAVADQPLPPIGEGMKLRLLVFGGSQGARFFSEVMPGAIEALPESIRSRLILTQQCREEDLERVTRAYAAAKVNVELATFFDDLPQRIAGSHLVIGRAGAGTIAELGVLGRPAILVPLPGSLDQDQSANAKVMEAAGGALVWRQDTISPQSLATELERLLPDSDRLTTMAARAATIGRADAVGALADFAEAIAEGAAAPSTPRSTEEGERS